MENHSLYNLIAKMGKVLSVDTRIELVTVGKDGYIFMAFYFFKKNIVYTFVYKTKSILI